MAEGGRHYHPSNDQIFKLDWPANLFLFQLVDKHKSGPPGDTLVSLNLPLFSDGWGAIKSVFGPDVQNYSQYWGVIQFLIPNFSAKISEVKVSSKQLTLSVFPKNIGLNDLVAKLYCEATPQVLQTDLTFKEPEVKVELGFPPYFYLVYLPNKKTGEVLDYRRFHLSWANLPKDVVMKATAEDVEQIIMRGEGSDVEFKQEFPRNWEEFAETVVAFANSRGGTIFLGVDDHSDIVGIKDQKTEDVVQDSLGSQVDPSIEVQITKHEVRKQPILAIQVKEGQNKPYIVRNRGPYVRAGKTDRIATRIELDEMYSKRGQIGLRPNPWSVTA